MAEGEQEKGTPAWAVVGQPVLTLTTLGLETDKVCVPDPVMLFPLTVKVMVLLPVEVVVRLLPLAMMPEPDQV